MLIEYVQVFVGVVGSVFAMLSVHLAYTEMHDAPNGPLQLVALRRLRQNSLVVLMLLIKTTFGVLTLFMEAFSYEAYKAIDFIITLILAFMATTNYLEIRFWPWEWKKD